jgi:hypothetical protein
LGAIENLVKRPVSRRWGAVVPGFESTAKVIDPRINSIYYSVYGNQNQPFLILLHSLMTK